MKNYPTIQFVNHASVIINYDGISILSDPWYKGPVFHNGWRLIHEMDDGETTSIIEKITHIYISHEHPDHFQPSFFLEKKIQKIIKEKKIKILFQHTRDKRVLNFFKKLNFNILELESNKKMNISKDFEVRIIKCGFYDSALAIKTPNLKILNLNDCPLRSKNEIKNFKKKSGSFDILLSQFSYAAWKGGVNNKIYRINAAKEKLNNLEDQAKILNCNLVIPFASFVYFSNELNYYMNDSLNKPENVTKSLIQKNVNTIFLQPGEIQNTKQLKQNQKSLEFWVNKYNKINLKIKDKYLTNLPLEDLNIEFKRYKNKIFTRNSKFLIFILSKIKFLNFFQPIKIKLLDHKKTYKYSIFNGLEEDYENKKDENYDIKMHSQSLLFIFKNEFGFDTLTVNGCFEANQDGFMKATKTLAIGNLNAMGLNFNFLLIFNSKILFYFFKILKKVKIQI